MLEIQLVALSEELFRATIANLETYTSKRR